ncbi:SPOR domain-containing protein [Sphingomonas sp. AX6]|uniref:SPOR domain-containing protein n=1 Tax=Sphingomonas sp. AX6 TaxID=2653171 RepID=UPI0012EF661F|nr:SPOR domain-containing protein [Sphingomonas sp. AX6]VXC76137.1 Sporulation protein [Sphingomonas sp. AX6]
MASRTILIAGLSTLAMCGVAIGGFTSVSAIANSAEESAMTKRAEKAAADARKALAKGQAERAIGHAEDAVLAMPGVAEHRVLLGKSYLAAGRFLSAGQAFDDALTIDPVNGGAALNLSLAKTALGDWAGARRTLDKFETVIAPGDRGLALALAGDPDGAVQLLGAVAREENATPTVRQNLALALALSDRWQEARAVAAIDLSPADVDQRIMQWAAFSRPSAASDQVASLLGVKAVEDVGQPVQLALKGSAPQMAEAAPAPEQPNFMDMTIEAPVAVAETAPFMAEPDVPAPVAVAVAQAEAPVPAAAGNPVFAVARIMFAERQEIVQALPANYRERAASPVRVAAKPVVPTRAVERDFDGGDYYVQLGAYDSAGVAQDAWGRMSRRVSALGKLRPQTAQANVGGVEYHRLAVGGLARSDANALCRQVQASGTRCFVRTHAGDRVASWARGVQVASR